MASTVPPNSRASSMARLRPPSDLAEPSTATTMCSKGERSRSFTMRVSAFVRRRTTRSVTVPRTVSLTAAMPMAPMTTRSKSLSLTSSTITLKFLPSRERRAGSAADLAAGGVVVVCVFHDYLEVLAFEGAADELDVVLLAERLEDVDVGVGDDLKPLGDELGVDLALPLHLVPVAGLLRGAR